MVKTIHLLLTYKCPLRCDHCYVFGGPGNQGVISALHLNSLFAQAKQVSTIEWIVFEGGEPFHYYPLLLRSVNKARKLSFKVGVLTNGFFARSEAAAIRYLHPLAKIGIDALFISHDRFHYNTQGHTPALQAGSTAQALGIPVTWKTLHMPGCENLPLNQASGDKDREEIRLLMVGRAADRLAARFPGVEPETLTTCPHESLVSPEKLSIDLTGNVQICPGLAIGNLWKNSLAEIIEQNDPYNHPVCNPLLMGGPFQLSRDYSCQPEGHFVDSCHLCYTTRRLLVDRFPDFLAPKQAYGIH
jgi:hypothetical protein